MQNERQTAAGLSFLATTGAGQNTSQIFVVRLSDKKLKKMSDLFKITIFFAFFFSHSVAKSAELVDQRRFKMDPWCHLVSSLFSPTVNHDFVCCVLSMLQRYFASYFSQYFGKTNMLSIILKINDTQPRGMSWRFFRTFKTSGVQDFGSCRF